MHTEEYGWTSESAESTGYIYPAILEEIVNESTVLDIGCGNGGIALRLMREMKNLQVYGIDADREGIAVANRKCNRNEKHFFECDFDEGKLPKEMENIQFDTIVSTEVIEHVYSPNGYIEFCKKAFAKNDGHGTIILSTPYHGYLKNLALSITNSWDKHHTVLWEGGHIKFWSRKTLTELLEENGFEVVKFKGCGRFPWLWKSMVIVARI